MEIRWEFPSNNHATIQGISDSGIENFRSKPILALAREICQNSLDAGLEGKTVRVEFELYNLPTSQFPDYSNFLNAIDRSISSWENESNKKTVKVLEEARNTLTQDSITFLRVSDYNTTGLRGSDKYSDTEWFNLVKATGSSNKGGSSGGSYGIGKFATFACSSLRTVFYSTLDIEGLEASQGIAKLVSFNLGLEDDPDLKSQGTGYYGNVVKLLPEKVCRSYHPGYQREESGTDIYIAGFKTEFIEDWNVQILKEILDNYLYAIYQGTLEIIIGNELLNKDSLGEIITKYRDAIHPNTRYYYEALTSDKAVSFEEDFLGQGNIELRLLISDDKAPKKVAMIRKPWMKIKEQDQINDLIPFVGVFIIKGEKLNHFLRRLENPSHNKWESSLAPTPGERKMANTLLKQMRQFIAEKLKSMLGADEVEQLDIEGASDFLPLDEDNTEDSNQSNIETLTPKILELKPKKKKEIQVKTPKSEAEDVEAIVDEPGSFNEGSDMGVPPHSDGSSGSSDGKGDIPVGTGDGNDHEVEKTGLVKLDFIKFFCINKIDNLYRVIFTPNFSASDCTLVLNQLDDQGEKVAIKLLFAILGNQDLVVKGNKASGFEIHKGKEESIDFSVDKQEYFSAEVAIYGNQK